MVDLLSEEADVAVVVAAVFREVRRLETKGDGMVVIVTAILLVTSRGCAGLVEKDSVGVYVS